MKVKVIKGTNQIGGCITEIESSLGTKIIIDFGEDLVLEGIVKSKVVIEGLTEGDSKYDAVFITHSHGDHIGLIENINSDIPIYIEKYNFEIYKKTYKYTSREFRNCNLCNKIINFDFSKSIVIKDIVITPYITDHSSFNSAMFLIECDGVRVLHSGDFRLHGRKCKGFISNLEKIGCVDLLITEGTAFSKEGLCISEDELKDLALDMFSSYNQVYILQSSTNIDRIVSFFKAKGRKKFVMDQFTCEITSLLGTNIPNVNNFNIYSYKPFGYLGEREVVFDKFKHRSFNGFNQDFVMMVKSSMFLDIKKRFRSNKKGLLVYSMWDGYIEKQKSLEKFIEDVKNLGIDFKFLHTSGHADIKGLQFVDKILGYPKVIGIHTKENEKGFDIFKNYISLNDEEEIEL